MSGVCWIFFFLLGAFLGGLLLWWLNRRRPIAPLPVQPSGEAMSPQILWLTLACKEALGECAKLQNLRRMDAAGIARRLFKRAFPAQEAYPLPWQYATWPKQAQLIFDCEFGALHEYQDSLREQERERKKTEAGSSLPQAGPSSTASDTAIETNADWLSLTLLTILAVATLITLLLASNNQWCAPATCPVVVQPPTKERFVIELPAEQLFDYSLGIIQPEAHRSKVKSDWKRVFSRYEMIKVQRIVAKTDPIGGSSYNSRLAKERQADVLAMLNEIRTEVPGSSGPDSFVVEGATNDSTAAIEQFQHDIWSQCKRRYNDELQEAWLRPLVPCKDCESTVPPAASWNYGEHMLASYRVVAQSAGWSTRNVVELMQNERYLISCLAPMRRVILEIEGTPRTVPSTAATAPAFNQGSKP